jgi:hypothetical protein
MNWTETGFHIWKLILDFEIGEFWFRWGFGQIRLLAFWDKTNKEETLVVATHGFIKKPDKVPAY